ncbi:unnamed protein product [Cuscuta campestris]|uniref:Replication factor A C-terminal domain-containing protein n=1 Tax=Cuscuta campestris TaxID=132261 RepID=A0A484KWE7_9ASTE|nr:unnamed protein product [Cuscuta campestris]
MIVIQLEADGVTLDITLFGEYVDKIKSFFGRQPLENAIIVIQYGKVKTYQGNINLQNVMYGTRILLNPEIEEVVAFRQRIVGVPTNRRPLELPCDDVTVVQQNEFLDATRMTTISLQGWAVRPDGTMYYCVYCGCRVMNVTPRYLIKLSVRDDSGSAIFVLFDHEAASILNTSCSLLLEKTDSDGSTESPKEFADFLMGKSFLFKVEVKSMFRGRLEQSFRNLPSGDIKPDVFNRLLIDKSYLFKVDVRRSQFNDFDPTYNVIDICFDERTISRFKERHATFFSVQNLIEDFVQSKDNQFERLGDDITDSNIGKRIEEVESDYADGHEPSKKMKTIKIEKI